MGFLIKDISEKFKNEAKEQKRRFLSMLLGTLLGASLLGSMFADEVVTRDGDGAIQTGEE